jgi:hypothetical protein
MPLNKDITDILDEWDIKTADSSFHASFKPYWSRTLSSYHDSMTDYSHYSVRNFFLSKTFNDEPQKRNQYNLQLHPIIDLESGFDLLLGKPRFTLGGGAHVKLNINNDFTFAGTVYGASMQLPFYLDTQVVNNALLPNYQQSYKLNNTNYSVFDYQGYVSYSPKNNSIFNFQLGKDKHFIGDGYRSVLLSDYAANYPYFRINTNIWRIQYHSWYTWMTDVHNASGIKSNFQNKFGTFHYLSWNIVKQVQLGLFENIIWQGTDTNRVRTFDINYLNPVIFFRPQEYSVGSPDNAFIGMNLNVKIARTLKLYGQLGLDEFLLKEIRARKGWWANKQAWQLGMKYINAFNVPHLILQFEYNQVRPYTYTHGSVPQNYGHYGQALAHPFGANFSEYLGNIVYRKSRWQFQMQGMIANIGKDSLNSNLGQNIFLSYTTRPREYGHKTGQGLRHTILQSDLKLSYHLAPKMGLRAEIGYIQRSEQFERRYNLQNPYFYLAIRSTFWNVYKDF